MQVFFFILQGDYFHCASKAKWKNTPALFPEFGIQPRSWIHKLILICMIELYSRKHIFQAE